MGATCCSSDAANAQKAKFEINTLDKLAQNDAKEALLKKKRNEFEGTEYDETKSPSPSPSPHNRELDFNVIDLQYIDKSKRRSSTSIDIDIFTYNDNTDTDTDTEDEKTNENECKSITECQCIKRLIIALKFYHKKQKKSNINDIIEFCEHTYYQLLNDYHHILFHHENDIEKLYQSLFSEYDISPCNIYKCKFVQRNQRNRLQIEPFDSKYNDNNILIYSHFWIDLLDSIHCYLLHIYDYGYRIKINNNEKEQIFKQTSYTSLDIKDDYCIDISFAIIKENILSQRKALNNINGFNRINTHKYNIDIGINEDKNKHKIMRVKSLSPKFCSHKQKHIRTDFNCGLKYYYWSYYKNKQEYIEGKYRDIKEEIMNNNICKLNKYQYEIVMIKANKIINTKYIKLLKTDFNKIKENHYEMDNNNLYISVENIVSVILYIDFEILSKELKKTFSAQRPNEPMFSIMNRHMEFRNWSKVLRETVNLYGMNIKTSQKYYIGSKYIITSSLSIRFRAPISMSGNLSIATRFIHDIDNGIILELSGNNQNDIKGFNCKFLSYFNAENEILFMGTKWKLKLCTIRILKNNINFINYFKAFYYFDLMLSGTKISSVEALKITKYDCKFLNALMSNEMSDSNANICMNKKDNKEESSKYLKEMFHFLCMDKETIVIDLILVNHYYKKLSKLILDENIVNLVTFDSIGCLFKNCKKIAVYAAMEEQKIDLENLLNEIIKSNCKHFEEIRIRCKHIQGGQSWLCNAWNTDLEFKYSQKLWKANFNIGKGTAFDDILILSQQKKKKLSRSATMARIKLKSKKLLHDV